MYLKKTFILFIILIITLLSASGCYHERRTEEVGASPPSSSAVSNETDPLTDVVSHSDLIVLGTITDKRYEVVQVGGKSDNWTPGKYAYTIFTLSVEKVIKGDPSTKEVLIRLAGGPIGEKYQLPIEGRWYFRISDHLLLSLKREDTNMYTLFHPGVLWIQGSAMSTTSLQEVMGRVAKNMLAQNIPIALDEVNWEGQFLQPFPPVYLSIDVYDTCFSKKPNHQDLFIGAPHKLSDNRIEYNCHILRCLPLT